jgi:hypothetical protein
VAARPLQPDFLYVRKFGLVSPLAASVHATVPDSAPGCTRLTGFRSQARSRLIAQPRAKALVATTAFLGESCLADAMVTCITSHHVRRARSNSRP